jgi:DNA repair protein RadC
VTRVAQRAARAATRRVAAAAVGAATSMATRTPEAMSPVEFSCVTARRSRTAQLYVRDGDAYCEAPAAVVLDCARRLATERFRTGAPVLSDPVVLHAFLTVQLAGREYEVFALILLDGRGRLIDYVELFRGTLDGAAVHPREVVKEALARNASSVLLVHNHPSGVPEPSSADVAVTRRLRDALAQVDVRVLDHLIVGESILSFADRGLI